MLTSLLTKYGQTIEYTDLPMSAEEQALSDLNVAEYAALFLQLEDNSDLQAEISERQQNLFKLYNNLTTKEQNGTN